MKNGDLPKMAHFYEWIDGALYSSSTPVGGGNGWVDEDDYLELRRYAESLLAKLEKQQ